MGVESKRAAIVECIGEEGYQRLRAYVAGRPGKRVYIPHADLPHKRRRYRLIDSGLLTQAEIKALGDRFGSGLRLRIPLS